MEKIRNSFILVWLMGGSLLMAQSDNLEICRQLGEQIQERFPGPFTEISPQPAENWWPDWSLDAEAPGQLLLRPPMVSYASLPDKRYLRQVSVDVMYQDSLMQSESFSYQDTLDKAAIKWVMKKSPRELRGENPRVLGRIAKPLLTIGGSILGVVALFYIRSR